MAIRTGQANGIEHSLNFIYSYVKFDTEMEAKKTTLISVIRVLPATATAVGLLKGCTWKSDSAQKNGAWFIIREEQ